jgi:nicotinamide riboside kinase
MERRKRDSVNIERLKDLLGETGKHFERLLLLSQSGAHNQTRHLARVMVEAETREDRKAFWQEVQRQFDENYQNVVELLESEYFIHH